MHAACKTEQKCDSTACLVLVLVESGCRAVGIVFLESLCKINFQKLFERQGSNKFRFLSASCFQFVFDINSLSCGDIQVRWIDPNY